ncbi:MAG TPA: endolytic transglycosylase MltG [Thermoanaerobaculia bacterium]|nr:endolytic transglycosylase MltG [Thermoanaerobaculia bacterium]
MAEKTAQRDTKGRSPARDPKERRRRRRRSRFGCCLVLALALVAAGGVLAFGWWAARPYQGYAGSEKLVDVAPGTGAARILDELGREGVLATPLVARAYLVYVLRNPPLQAGEYRFAGPMTFQQVLHKLIRGDVVSRGVTVVEGFAIEDIANQLAQAGAGRRETFLELMRSPALIADLDPAAADLEGYLFPETYRFRVGTSEAEIVATLVKTFRSRFERTVRPLMAGAVLAGKAATVHEVVTLAGIVEKEARADAERPVVAGVYRNRLLRHMALDADPTIIFALRRLDRWDGHLHHEDLQLESPYNTYRYAGLPPGPICSPGLPSLQAAARPADVPYLYFVSRNDGTHVFATTLEEQNRNVQIWQRQYWRDRREQERREAAGEDGGAPVPPGSPGRGSGGRQRGRHR